MKKFILLFTMVLLSSVCFAKDDKIQLDDIQFAVVRAYPFTLGVYLGDPFISLTTVSTNGDERNIIYRYDERTIFVVGDLAIQTLYSDVEALEKYEDKDGVTIVLIMTSEMKSKEIVKGDINRYVFKRGCILEVNGHHIRWYNGNRWKEID